VQEEKIFYENEEQKIAAVLHTPANRSDKGVILLHGFGGDKDFEGGGDLYPSLARLLCSEGYSVLRFDCRGSGESDGNFEDMTLSSEVSDLKRSIAFLKERDITKITVLGSSLGGCVTLLAYEDNMDCIVLWYPVIFPQETEGFKFLREREHELHATGKIFRKHERGKDWHVGKVLYEEWRDAKPWEKLHMLRCPVLIVSGDNDSALSMERAEEAINLISSPKKLVIIPGAYHCWKNVNKEIVDKYKEQAFSVTIDWIKKWLQ